MSPHSGCGFKCNPHCACKFTERVISDHVQLKVAAMCANICQLGCCFFIADMHMFICNQVVIKVHISYYRTAVFNTQHIVHLTHLHVFIFYFFCSVSGFLVSHKVSNTICSLTPFAFLFPLSPFDLHSRKRSLYFDFYIRYRI